MNIAERKAHWNNIYQTRKLDEVSWYQPVPHTSLELIENLGLSRQANILDVGGGDSYLTDHLLDKGFTNLFLLDVSAKAIERAKNRHGAHRSDIEYIISDITEFQPKEPVDLWHDRAVLHFLTADEEIQKYVSIVQAYVREAGYVIIGVFSKDGPTKCSGIEIRQYDEETMKGLLGNEFNLIKSFRTDHPTPSQKTQNFIFSVFQKRGSKSNID